MGETPNFECLRCAACCKNLLENSDGILRGLLLTKNEVALFSPDLILPKLAVGLKTPEMVILYQLTASNCMHLNQLNECRIYAKRPLICQSFPILAGDISSRCRVFSYRKPGVTYSETHKMTYQVEASTKLERYIENQIKKHCRKGLKLWEFDLRNRSWVEKGDYNSN